MCSVICICGSSSQKKTKSPSTWSMPVESESKIETRHFTKGDERKKSLFVIHRQLHKFSCWLLCNFRSASFFRKFHSVNVRTAAVIWRKWEHKLKFDTHIFLVYSLILWKISDTLEKEVKIVFLGMSNMPKKQACILRWVIKCKFNHCHSKLLHFSFLFDFFLLWWKCAIALLFLK